MASDHDRGYADAMSHPTDPTDPTDPAHPTAPMTALEQLHALEAAVHRFRTQGSAPMALRDAAVHPPLLLAALPPRYGEVLQGLLDRLESSALFTDESCSFSQKDLLDTLQQRLDKAREVLLRKS